MQADDGVQAVLEQYLYPAEDIRLYQRGRFVAQHHVGLKAFHLRVEVLGSSDPHLEVRAVLREDVRDRLPVGERRYGYQYADTQLASSPMRMAIYLRGLIPVFEQTQAPGTNIG